jgi:hypothetical protein
MTPLPQGCRIKRPLGAYAKIKNNIVNFAAKLNFKLGHKKIK